MALELRERVDPFAAELPTEGGPEPEQMWLFSGARSGGQDQVRDPS